MLQSRLVVVFVPYDHFRYPVDYWNVDDMSLVGVTDVYGRHHTPLCSAPQFEQGMIISLVHVRRKDSLGLGTEYYEQIGVFCTLYL